MNMNESNTAVEVKVETLLRRLCEGLIKHTQDLSIVPSFRGGNISKYRIRAHVSDVGRIVGTGGERFNALKFLCQTVGMKEGRQIVLERPVESIGGKRERFDDYEPRADWPKEQIEKLLNDVCEACFKVKPVVSFLAPSHFMVACDVSEPLHLMEALRPYLQNVFNGIGTTNGQQLEIPVDYGLVERGR